MTAALKEELNVEMISLGGLQVPESVVVSWGIMLFLVIVSILLTRNLKVDHISRRQAILELVVTTIDNFFTGLLGEQGRRYVPYLMTVALYIACANLIGDARHQAPDEGSECHRCAGAHEHLASSSIPASMPGAARASSRASPPPPPS